MYRTAMDLSAALPVLFVLSVYMVVIILYIGIVCGTIKFGLTFYAEDDDP